MPRKSRKEEIIRAIREYLIDAVMALEPITNERLMKVVNCSRATFYKYVTKGSAIEREIEVAKAKQKSNVETSAVTTGQDPGLRKRLEKAVAGDRELLAFISRMTANLIKYGVPTRLIQAAQREATPHPNRSFSHTGKGRRRK